MHDMLFRHRNLVLLKSLQNALLVLPNHLACNLDSRGRFGNLGFWVGIINKM